jgi:probable HAF family extracellular repeat protein
MTLLRMISMTALATTALTAPAWAEGSFDNLGAAVSGFHMEEIVGISGNGMHFVGVGYDQPFTRTAGFYGSSTGVVEIGGFGNDTIVREVSNNGVVVGYGSGEFPYEAFYWTEAGGVNGIGTLEPGNVLARSFALAVSDDGRRIVGQSDTDEHGGYQAFLWIMGAAAGVAGNEQMYVLDSLVAGRSSSATALTSDGRYAVGSSAGAGFSAHAVRWSLDGVEEGGAPGILDLGTLGGTLSWANDISDDGRVVVGRADDGGTVAFRWVEGGTGGAPGNPQMQSLGTFGGSHSEANAVSGDGNIVVGRAEDGDGLDHAFRWTEGAGLVRLADWLAENDVDIGGLHLEAANAVSDDGNIVGGLMLNDEGEDTAFLARVEDGGSGIMDVAAYTQTLLANARTAQMGVDLTWMPLNGAHHRPLMAQGRMEDDVCLWNVNDLAYKANTNTGIALTEVGGCGRLGDGVVAGLGVGSSTSWQGLDLGGNAQLAGAYVMGEVDWNPDGTPLLLSLTGVLGGWQANVNRAYTNGAVTEMSSGSTGVTAGVVRARVDWQDAAVLGKVSINPWISGAIGRTDMGGYTESGGAFPARFDAQGVVQGEVRLGVTAEAELSPQTTLSGTLEVAHRGGDAVAANGQVLGLFDFGLGGGTTGATWARAGVDLDHRITESVRFSGSLHAATQGQDATLSGSLGLRAAF